MPSLAKRPAKTGRTKTSECWWTATPAKVADEVFCTVKAVRKQLQRQRQEDLHHSRLYGNLNVAGNGWSTDTRMQARMRFNLCRTMVNTAQSIVAQQRPRPQYLTTLGSWSMQRDARLRTQVLEGQLHDCGAYEWGPEVQRDGGVNGTGFVLGTLDENDEPTLTRLFPSQVLVDHNDGIMRKPRSKYVKWAKPRESLMAEYPECADIIRKASGPTPDDREDFFLTLDDTTDPVVVVEAWHMESRPARKGKKGSGDGRHVIATSSGVLVDEPYTERRIPIAEYRWTTRQAGYYGAGIIEECRDAQWRINRLIAKGDRLSDLMTNAHIMVDRGSKMRIETATNEPAKIYEYNGGAGIAPPQFNVINGVPPQIQLEIEQIKTDTAIQLGLSQAQQQSEVPKGLDSGKAIRAYEDVGSRRHIINGRIYEDFFMDMVDLLEMLNEQAARVNPSYTVTARSSRGRQALVQQVKWSDVHLPENKYRLQMWPTSALPSTPAGKWAAVQEWVDGGWVSRPFAQQLLDFPDLEASMRIELADMDAVMHDVEQILDGKTNVRPVPYQDLAMAADVARRSYLQARIMDAPPEVLLELREYIDDANRQIAESTAAAAPPAPPMPMMPPAMPGEPMPMDPSLAAPPVAMA